MKYIWLIFIFLPLFISCGETSHEAVLLRLNPDEGKIYQMNLETDMHIQSAGLNVETNIRFDSEMKIAAVSEDTIDILVDYNRMRVSQQIPFVGKIEFDSDEPTASKGRFAEKYQEISEEVLKNTSTLKLNKYGRVLSSTDVTNLGSDPLSGGAPTGDELVGNIMAVFPEEKVKIGDSWQKEVKIAGQLSFTIDYIYTIQDVTKDEVIIDISGKIKSSTDNPDASFSAEGIKGTVSGEMTVSRKTGWTRLSEITQQVEMTVGQGNQQLPMKMKTIIRIKNE